MTERERRADGFQLSDYEMPSWCTAKPNPVGRAAPFLSRNQQKLVPTLRWALLLDGASLTPAEHLVGLRIYVAVGDNRDVCTWVSVSKFAAWLGLTRATVRAAIDLLAADGWLVVGDRPTPSSSASLYLSWPEVPDVMLPRTRPATERCGKPTSTGKPCRRSNNCARHREPLASTGHSLTTPGQPLTAPGHSLTPWRSTSDHDFVIESFSDSLSDSAHSTASAVPDRREIA